MTDLQQYQKYRLKRETTGSKVFKLILWIILILFVIWLFKGCFTSNKEEVAENQNVNTSEEANTNESEGLSSNENINAAAITTTSFDLENCQAAFSQGQSRKEVALTFDGASETSGASKVIDILKSNSIPASFFFTGIWVENNPDIIKDINNQGFPIFNLTYSYPHVAGLAAEKLVEELKKGDQAVSGVIEKSTKPFFRPPFGEIDDNIFTTVKEEGYCPILWTVDAFDWQSSQTADGAKERVLDRLKNGTIVLMHAGNELVPEFLQDLINEIKNRGYGFVSLAEILTP